MPTIRNKETIDIIVDNYCTNGQNKTKALLDAGYDDEYADSGNGHKIYGNVRVKEAIDKRMAELREKVEYDYKQAHKALESIAANLRPKAEAGDIQANQALTAVIREKDAITGLHKQTILGDKPLEQPQFTEDEVKRLKEQAKAITEPAIKVFKEA